MWEIKKVNTENVRPSPELKAKTMNWIKKIFSNNNKKTTTTFSSESVAAVSSGISLSEGDLLKIPEFFSGLDMIANSVAMIEYKPTEIESRNNDTLKTNKLLQDNELYEIMNKTPNTFQTKHVFWKQNIFNYFLRGAFYLFVYRNEKNKVEELIPIDPNKIEKVKTADGNFVYELITEYEESTYGQKPKTMLIPYEDIIAVHYAALERIEDLTFANIFSSLLEQLSLKNKFDKNQLNFAPRLLAHVKSVDNLDDEQRKKVKTSITTFFRDSKDPDKSSVLVTDPRYEVNLISKEGSKIQSSIDEGFVKELMRKFANALHIPMPLLGFTESTSQYKSREGIYLDYLNNAIAPIIDNILAAFNKVIFGKDSNKEFKFSSEKLMQFDKQTLGEFSVKMQGILTINELRKLNGYPPLDGFDRVIAMNGNPVDLDENKMSEKKEYNNGGVKNADEED